VRILYISHLHPPEDALLENMGGMQRVSIQLVNELKKRNDIELKTVILKAPWKNIEFRATGFLFRLIWKLPALVRKFDADVVLFSSMVTASVSLFIRNRIDVPLVTINHGQDVTLPVNLYQKMVPRIFEKLDGVISVSNATRQACIERGMDPEKGVSLPNGFAQSDIGSYPDRLMSRNELEKFFNINLDDRYLLLTVGRLVKRKGHSWFIKEVLPKVKKDVVYLVIGNGPELDRVQLLANASDCKDRVIIAGRQPDDILKKAYAAADLFMMPNIPVPGDMEGFGIVLLEANLAGTPAIASDLEGIRDVIENGQNGYRIPAGHSDEFASVIDKVLGQNLNAFRDKARSYVVEHFSWEHVADQYINYLKTVSAPDQSEKKQKMTHIYR